MAKEKKPACKYGSKCYRKNKDHLRDYDHGHGDNMEEKEPPAKKQCVEKKEAGVTKKTITDFFGQKQETTKEEKAEPDNVIKAETNKIHHDISDDEEVNNGKDCEPKSKSEESSNKNESESEDREEETAAEACEVKPASPEDIKESIKQKFLVEMPPDFYAFWEFSKTLNPSCPNTAFKATLGLELVGPYDLLAGRHRNARNRNPCYLRHWRYYYDPPEVTTVVRGDADTQFHMGYFRDDPKEMPVFVVSNAAATNCQMAARGENLFTAFSWFIDDISRKNKSKKESLAGLKAKIVAAAKEGSFPLESRSQAMRAREKKVNCKLFHGAGMVVPVDKATGVGYREVPETIGDMKKMFQKVVDAKSDADRDKAFDPIMEIIMLIQFANDECDYGEGLELGLDMFCHGSGDTLKSNILNLTGLAYELLGRHEYKRIMEAHLKDRQHTAQLSQLE